MLVAIFYAAYDTGSLAQYQDCRRRPLHLRFSARLRLHDAFLLGIYRCLDLGSLVEASDTGRARQPVLVFLFQMVLAIRLCFCRRAYHRWDFALAAKQPVEQASLVPLSQASHSEQ